MADTTTEAPTADAQAAPEAALGDAGRKALDSEREARKAAEREVKALREQLAAEQAASKGRESDLQAKLDAKSAELDSTSLELARSEVMRAKGLTPELAAFLVGSTREELEAQADKLLAAMPTPPEGSPAPLMRPNPFIGGSAEPALNDVDPLVQALGAAVGVDITPTL